MGRHSMIWKAAQPSYYLLCLPRIANTLFLISRNFSKPWIYLDGPYGGLMARDASTVSRTMEYPHPLLSCPSGKFRKRIPSNAPTSPRLRSLEERGILIF